MSPLAKLGKKGSLLLSLASVLGWVAYVIESKV